MCRGKRLTENIDARNSRGDFEFVIEFNIRALPPPVQVPKRGSKAEMEIHPKKT